MIVERCECDLCRKEITRVPTIKIDGQPYEVLPVVPREQVTSHVCYDCLIKNLQGRYGMGLDDL